MKYLTILSLVLALSCQPQEVPTTLSEAELSTVKDATTQYGTAIIASDFAQMKALLAPDVILMPTEDTNKKGIDDTIGFFESGPGLEGSISPDHVEGSGSLAYVRGHYNITFIVNDSVQTSDTGKYIELWKKQDDGSWKIAIDIWNSDISSEM